MRRVKEASAAITKHQLNENTMDLLPKNGGLQDLGSDMWEFTPDVIEVWKMCLTFAIVTLPYGSVHFLAWNGPFPSHAVLVLWRSGVM